MSKLALPALSTLVGLALLSGCGTASTKARGVPTGLPLAPPSHVAAGPSAGPTDGTAAGAPSTTPPATTAGSTAPSTTAPTTAPASATRASSAATLDYVGPISVKRLRVTKTVTGAMLARLTDALDSLAPNAGHATCSLDNGETGTLTLTKAGHKLVYVIPGSPCRGVSVTSDGKAQPMLSGSMALVTDIRDIAGLKGLAHPGTT